MKNRHADTAGEGVGWTGRLGLTYINNHVQSRQLLGATQSAGSSAPPPMLRDDLEERGGGRWEGGSRGRECMHTCGWKLRKEYIKAVHCHLAYLTSLQSSLQFSSVAQSCPTLRPHGLQHTRLPCPSSTPRACSNSCLSSRWCHPTISSSVIPSPTFNLPSIRVFSNESIFSHQVAKVLEFQLKHQSFQWIFRTEFV